MKMFSLTPPLFAIPVPESAAEKLCPAPPRRTGSNFPTGNASPQMPLKSGVSKCPEEFCRPLPVAPEGLAIMDERRAKNVVPQKETAWVFLRHQASFEKKSCATRQVAALNSSSEQCLTCATVSEISFT